MPRSPLTGSFAETIESIPVSSIVDVYKSSHQIDVAPHLPAIDEIVLYKCRSTWLEFFGPGDLSGSPEFYRTLYSAEGADWGYSKYKWEFAAGRRLLPPGKFLDIGCGAGAFIESAQNTERSGVGLETSPYGWESALAKGIDARKETVVEHAQKFAEEYEAVTAFQVLEHVADPAAFLKAAIALLKPGGTLIVSVPNSRSFLKHCRLLALNLPPHHVTLWNEGALGSLRSLFNLEIVSIRKEPLQAHNVKWYASTMENARLPKSALFRRIYYRLGAQHLFFAFLAVGRHFIDGHTILAAYKKPAGN